MGALKGKLCDWLVSKEKYPDWLKSQAYSGSLVAFCYRDNNSTQKFWKSEAVNVRWLKTAEIKIFLCWKDRKKYGRQPLLFPVLSP